MGSAHGRRAARRLRCARVDPRDYRRLRRAFLFRQPANPRNRHSHGYGRANRPRAPPRGRPGYAPRRRGSGARLARRFCRHAPARQLAVRRQRARPAYVRRCVSSTCSGRSAGLLHPRAPRHQGRPHHRPALRIERANGRRNRKSFLSSSIRRKHISSIFVSLDTETPMRTLLQDLRYAFRQFRKSPGFVITAILSLMLGIGATTAIFSVVYGVLLDTYPYKDNNRMVHVQLNDKKSDRGPLLIVNGSEYKDLRKIPSLDDVFLARNNQRNLTGDQIPVSVNVGLYSTNLFEYMGVPPLLCREFTKADAP